MTEYILSYIWVLFIMVSAICNAIMDTCKDHYSVSIFTKLNPQFWNTEISWRNKYNKFLVSQGRNKAPTFLTDSWHLFKSTMIVSLAFALMFASMYYKPFYTYFESILTFGIVWNGTFNLFYNKLLIKKIKK